MIETLDFIKQRQNQESPLEESFEVYIKALNRRLIEKYLSEFPNRLALSEYIENAKNPRLVLIDINKFNDIN